MDVEFIFVLQKKIINYWIFVSQKKIINALDHGVILLLSKETIISLDDADQLCIARTKHHFTASMHLQDRLLSFSRIFFHDVKLWLHCSCSLKLMNASAVVKTAHDCSTVKINWKLFYQFRKAVKPAVGSLFKPMSPLECFFVYNCF